MQIKFGKSLFGFNPGEVINEIHRMDSENQERIRVLQAEIELARIDVKKSEEKTLEFQKRLNEYTEREHIIADVMLKAQINARKIEDEARERSRIMLERSEEELRKKNQELELLRMKVERFREEFRGILDEYKISLETMKIPSDTPFTPTLVVKEKSQGSLQG